MNKRWVRIVLIAIAVLFVIILVLPLLINVNRYRPKIEADATCLPWDSAAALTRDETSG